MSEEATETSVDVRGTTIRVLGGGDGPPLLFLHGAGDRGVWYPVLASLAERYTVYRPDHPGFGGSDNCDTIDSVHDLAFFYLDFLDVLGVERCRVVGASLGGWIAADLATVEPARVEKLVLVQAAGVHAEGVSIPDLFVLDPVQTVELVYHREDLREAAVQGARKLGEYPGALEDYLRNRMATAHLVWNPYLHDPKLPERLHRIQAPTLVVWGANDRLLPLGYGRRWEELLPKARFHVINESGHMPYIEQPDEFVDVVLGFLDAPEPEATTPA